MKRKFSAEERRSLLLNQLKADGKIYVTDLMKQFDVSEVSIRKDLAVLEEKKLLLRVKGGAVDMHQSVDYDDMTISQKQHLHAREKQLLGKFAASMIRNGETIILDSGTTTMEIAKNLLSNPKVPIGAVAARCGYSDASLLRRMFKSATGMSLREYRKSLSK